MGVLVFTVLSVFLGAKMKVCESLMLKDSQIRATEPLHNLNSASIPKLFAEKPLDQDNIIVTPYSQKCVIDY